MEKELINKKVEVAVAFAYPAHYSTMPEIYTGVLLDSDENFIKLQISYSGTKFLAASTSKKEDKNLYVKKDYLIYIKEVV